MPRTWLLLDVSYMGHRAMHSTGVLRYKGRATGVLFGVLRDLATFCDYHDTPHVAFCFDGRGSLRKDLYPLYKERLGPLDPVEVNNRKELHEQLDLLRTDVLPSLGFRNVFCADGYEGDDLVAACCNALGADEGVIVSADRDYYQLIHDRSGLGGSRVVCWDPNSRRTTDVGSFIGEWGLNPLQWVMVKALAGCKSDCVPGIDGVGEKTAAKFLSGRLGIRHKTMPKFGAFVNSDQYMTNLRLVELPFQGCPDVELVDDGPAPPAGWRKVCKRFGFGSLLESVWTGGH